LALNPHSTNYDPPRSVGAVACHEQLTISLDVLKRNLDGMAAVKMNGK
jgi:hypothetical protein